MGALHPILDCSGLGDVGKAEGQEGEHTSHTHYCFHLFFPVHIPQAPAPTRLLTADRLHLEGNA